MREGWPEVADFNDHMMRTVLGGATLSYTDQELTLLRSGRPEQVWMNLDYSPVIGPAGTPEGVIAIVVETTAKVQAEANLRVTAAALASLNAELERRVTERTAERDRVWQHSRDLLAVVGTDGIYCAANPAWRAILGLAPEQVIGHSFREFVWPDDIAATRRAIDDAAERDLNNFENRYRHRDGAPRWIAWHTSAEGELVYAYGRDITAEKEQAEALRQAEEQLRQAQKMEAVGQLTGGLAHDFNNLLTGIAGSLELMRTRIAQGRTDELDRYIGAAQGATERASALTHRLLAFSRRQTLAPNPTDVNHLVGGMEELIRRTMGPDIAVEVVAEPAIWTTLVDTNQLENALLNLCINARDAMPDGGNLTIQTGNEAIDGQAARDRDLPAGEYVTLAVVDTGVGMTPDVAARAFDPFFTTKPIGLGTGLGLSMIYGFVRQSGGQARIITAPGAGTTVRLYLPRHLGPAATAVAPPRVAETPRAGQGETVLVVDDEAALRMLMADALVEAGYDVAGATNGAEALSVLRSAARLDLLITDVGLSGGMNGRQVADAARELRPGLPVLFITGYAETAVLNQGQLEPGMHIMTKPFALKAMAARVKAIIAGTQ